MTRISELSSWKESRGYIDGNELHKMWGRPSTERYVGLFDTSKWRLVMHGLCRTAMQAQQRLASRLVPYRGAGYCFLQGPGQRCVSRGCPSAVPQTGLQRISPQPR